MNGFIRKLAIAGTGAYVVWGITEFLRDERTHTTKVRKTEVHRWEGEGGNFAPHEQAHVMPTPANSA